MTLEHNERSHGHTLVRRFAVTTIVVVSGAIAATWSWNTIVPDLAGLAEFRFAEGLSIAILTLLLGALFETGRRLVVPRGEPGQTR